MKTIFITLFFSLLLSFSCKAQLNNLTDTELFEGIRFNNVSLGAIMVASGDLTKMRALFGDSIQEIPNDSAPFLAKSLYNDNFSFGFEDETDTGNNYDLAYIYIKNSSVTVTVKGLSIKIGDDKSKFGNLLFNSKYKRYNFTDQDTGSVGLSFQIDSSNKVSDIELICF